jgi:hypothetical protein
MGRLRRAALGAFALTASAAAAPHPALAWGDDGHRVVAYIANAFLTPAVRVQADALLRADADPSTGRDMASRATWADLYSRAHPQTAGWHLALVSYDRPDLKATCAARPCSTGKIVEFEQVLANRAAPAPTRTAALIWLLNLVADVHQPLDTIEWRHDGGGVCEVISAGHGLETLHEWWDKDVVDALGGRQPGRLGPELAKRVTRRELQDWSRGSAADWAAQSYQVAKTEVYAYSSAPHCKMPPDTLSSAYVTTSEQVAAGQLERAGVRLAAILNATLAPLPPPSPPPPLRR